MASKKKQPNQNKKGEKKEKSKSKSNDLYGYIPSDLCEFISQKSKEEEPKPNVIDDVQKKKFLRQISELQQRVEGYARQMDELSVNLTLYPPKFKKIEADTNDISKYLSKLLEEREAECQAKREIQETAEEELKGQKEIHEKTLADAKKELEDMKNDLIPSNLELKEQLDQLKDLEAAKNNVESIIETSREELRQKALKHHAEMYEREKETVRELFEIRELIPTWVKKVSDENKIIETNRIHRILNNYRVELGDLLKKYIGRPNQLSRRAIQENKMLKNIVDKKTLNIKLIEENMEAMKRRGESDVHEMHDLASNVKENRILLKSFENNPLISAGTSHELRSQVVEGGILLKRARESFDSLKKDMFEISSNLQKLDDANFKIQGVIRSFQVALHKILSGQTEYEKLLGNLRVASCLEILEEKNDTFSRHICCRLVDPYKIYQTIPVVRPKTP